MSTFNVTKRAFARERLAISNSSTGLTAATYGDASATDKFPATGARVVVETAPVRFTEDGSAADATADAEVGIRAEVGDQIIFESYQALAKARFIAATSDDSVLQVVYYR